MDVNVRVTVDLGEKTMSLFDGIRANAAVAKASETVSKVLEKYDRDEPEPVKEEAPEKPTRTRNRAAKLEAVTAKPDPEEATPATEPEEAAGFDGMDDDAKLEAIRAEVAKNVKKGRSSDVKFMLAQFDADKAGSLDPKDYKAFYDAIQRYGKGEALEELFPSDLG